MRAANGASAIVAGVHMKGIYPMRTSAKLGLTALIAALLLASAISTASARNLSTSSQTLRTTWSVLDFASELVTIRCSVTLEGSFHSRTIPKVERLLIGAVTRVDIKNETCTNGTATVSRLPWHITYEGFAGTLPAINGIFLLLSRFHFILRTLGLECGYGGSENITGRANLTGGEVTTLEPVSGRNTANRTEGSGFCPVAGRLVNAGGVTVLNSTARIRVTLI